MLPTFIQDRIDYHKAVAAGLRDSAGLCTSVQGPLRERFLSGAQSIDELVEMVESATWVAKLNHDTIKNRETA